MKIRISAESNSPHSIHNRSHLNLLGSEPFLYHNHHMELNHRMNRISLVQFQIDINVLDRDTVLKSVDLECNYSRQYDVRRVIRLLYVECNIHCTNGYQYYVNQFCMDRTPQGRRNDVRWVLRLFYLECNMHCTNGCQTHGVLLLWRKKKKNNLLFYHSIHNIYYIVCLVLEKTTS